MNRFPCAASAAFFIALAMTGCQSVPTPRWPIPEGVLTAPVNGYPMAYREGGSGPTVVMIAGVMCDYRCLGNQVKGLSANLRAITISLRHSYPEKWDGTGKTFSLDQHAKDVTAFIEKVGAPVNLLAHSYGARVAYEVARTRPELVRKLVLAEAPTDSIAGGSDSEENAVQQTRAMRTERLFRSDGIDAGQKWPRKSEQRYKWKLRA